MKKLRLVLSYTLLSLVFPGLAQDVELPHHNQNLLELNPSFAGGNGAFRNQLNYRNQYPQLTGNVVTYANAADFYLDKIGAGVGFTAKSQSFSSGLLNYNEIGFVYAQHFKFGSGDLTVIPSGQINYNQWSLDAGSLTAGQLVRNNIWTIGSPVPSPRRTFIDINSGVLVNYKKILYAGASVMHITQPEVGFWGTEKLPMRINLHAAYTIHLSDKHQMQLFHRFSRQDKFVNYQLATNFLLWKHLTTGIGFGSGTHFSGNVGYRHSWFSVGIGYDTVYSRLFKQSYVADGAWQFNASFSFGHARLKQERATNFEAW